MIEALRDEVTFGRTFQQVNATCLYLRNFDIEPTRHSNAR